VQTPTALVVLALAASLAACASAEGAADAGARPDAARLPDAAPLADGAPPGGDGGGEADAGSSGVGPVLNEVVVDNPEGDTCEYVEIAGEPGRDYSRFSILVLEGDLGADPGSVDRVIVAGTASAEGLWVSELLSGAIENGSQTLLLVADTSAGIGDDLDTDDDGTLDLAPWSALVDAVAITDDGISDVTYAGDAVLSRTFDGGNSYVRGASRIPDGADSDQASDWVRNSPTADGLPCADGTAAPGEALNTPGAPNAVKQ